VKAAPVLFFHFDCPVLRYTEQWPHMHPIPQKVGISRKYQKVGKVFINEVSFKLGEQITTPTSQAMVIKTLLGVRLGLMCEK